jgi:hypothetical protein
MRFLLALCCFVSGICSADTFNGPTDLTLKYFDDLVIHGPAKLRMVKAKSLDVKGSLEFNQLAVKGKAEIIGEFKGKRGKFGKLNVTGLVDAEYVVCDELSVLGPVKIAYLEVKNTANIKGEMQGRHCKIKRLIVQAARIVLEDVEIGSILVKKDGRHEELILKGTSLIDGDIEFESGTGTVKIEGSAVKIQGEIRGSLKK